MSEQLKYIVDELNKEPFKKNYNLISFDSLQPLQLLQVLNDVFAEINPQHKIDLRDEEPEQMAKRMFTFLRILKFKPKTDSGSLNSFRNGLIQGDKLVVYPILHWLFENLAELKTRAYLARYLVKLEVPPDQLGDQELNDLNVNYLDLMEQFKELHKTVEQLRTSGLSTGEIKKDIVNMEDEKEQLQKRIDRMQKKVENVRNYEKMLQAARNLRVEREKEHALGQQKLEQKNQYLHSDQRYQRMLQQLKDMRAQGVGTTGADLIKRLEEENKVNVYLCQEKLPKELEGKKKYAQDLQKVADEPAMGQTDVDELNKRIKQLSAEINTLIEKRMVRNDPIDDKLSLFRQQASIIGRKKEAAAEKLQEAMDEVTNAESDLQKKKELLKESEGSEVLKGDEFKRYVNKLRGKSTVYKKKRQELAELRAEYGVLARTEEILQGKDESFQQQLSNLESKKGVSGFHETQEELEKVSAKKSELDEQKGKTLEDISELVRQLNGTIADKKSALAPVIKELRPMRQKCQEMTGEYEEKKAAYENLAAGLESNMSKLEQEVRGLREELTHEEGRYHYLHCMLKVLEVQQKRIDDELKAYRSADTADRKKSFREQFTKKIQEQENLGKSLRDKQKTVRESQAPNMKQMKMWSDLAKLLECKRNCMVKQQQEAQNGDLTMTQQGQDGENVLVL
ncbi:intraflagellar transport protein 81 homolog [Orbicella faveolata]|uniref:intraflagellar transport protein 81 homolog n=1 Tax=Orbicella faveolata TaxID=48498 RepID=UPI0009E2194D|nr:intraflagellar transport protein 81 homolog [Orbicella faveolata]